MSAEWNPSDAVPATEPERPVGPGTRLRETREARGLSPAQAAEQLKLKRSIIEALEADHYERLPSILFARGYLRSYARLLELPAGSVIASFESLGLVEEQPAMPKGAILTHKRRGEHLLLRWGSAVVLVVLGALLVAWYQGESTTSLLVRLGIDGGPGNGTPGQSRVELPAAPQVSQPGGDVTPAPLPALAPPQHPRESAPAAASEPQPKPESPQPRTTPVESSPTVQSPAVVTTPVEPVSTAPGEPAQPPTKPLAQPPVVAAEPTATTPRVSTATAPPGAAVGSDHLVLELQDDSWTEVTDARGERLVYQLLKAGTLHEVTGEGPFDIFLGNAPGVELRFNGEPVTNIRANRRGVARVTLGETVTN